MGAVWVPVGMQLHDGGARMNEQLEREDHDTSADQIRHRLIEVGRRLPTSTRERVLALGPAAVPPLFEVLIEEPLQMNDGSGLVGGNGNT